MASSGFGGTEVGARSPSLSRLEQFQLQVLQGYTVTYDISGRKFNAVKQAPRDAQPLSLIG